MSIMCSACDSAVKEAQGEKKMKKVVKSSMFAGAVVAIMAFAVADVGGPVLWAGYWLAVVSLLARA